MPPVIRTTWFVVFLTITVTIRAPYCDGLRSYLMIVNEYIENVLENRTLLFYLGSTGDPRYDPLDPRYDTWIGLNPTIFTSRYFPIINLGSCLKSYRKSMIVPFPIFFMILTLSLCLQ